jgi:hypothetical protein
MSHSTGRGVSRQFVPRPHKTQFANAQQHNTTRFPNISSNYIHITMGCQASKSTFDASRLDDSIHTMLERERRQAAKNGKQLLGYRPRAPLPSQIKLTKLI